MSRADREPVRELALVSVALVVLSIVFCCPLLVPDGTEWIRNSIDTSTLGDPMHLIQVVLVRWAWRALSFAGVGVDKVFYAFGLAGNFVAAIYLGRIAWKLTSQRSIALAAGALYGAALVPATYWHGELYSLANCFSIVAWFFALRGRLSFAMPFWALGVAGHIEHALLFPAFGLAAWINMPASMTTAHRLRRVITMWIISGLIFIAMTLAISWYYNRWYDLESMKQWLAYSQSIHGGGFHVNPAKAIKGLLSAFSAAGATLADLAQGRVSFGSSTWFAASVVLSVVTVGLVVLLSLGAFAEKSRRRAAFIALSWVIPVHVGFNWSYEPQTAEYHATAVPGFVLLLALGLAHSRKPRFVATIVVTVFFCAFNYAASIIPIWSMGRGVASFSQQIVEASNIKRKPLSVVRCVNYVPFPKHADKPHDLEVSTIVHRRRIENLPVTHEEILADIERFVERERAVGRDVVFFGDRCVQDPWDPVIRPEAGVRFEAVIKKFKGEPVTPSVAVPRSSFLDPFSWIELNVHLAGS